MMTGATSCILILPAYAGMYLNTVQQEKLYVDSPRICGDVSQMTMMTMMTKKFSPHMRGCIGYQRSLCMNYIILPAYAGMYLAKSNCQSLIVYSPRICGDVSKQTPAEWMQSKFSPHMRGYVIPRCSDNAQLKIFPACAGIYLVTRNFFSPYSHSSCLFGNASYKAIDAGHCFPLLLQGCIIQTVVRSCYFMIPCLCGDASGDILLEG